jgi:hypothetical protein
MTPQPQNPERDALHIRVRQYLNQTPPLVVKIGLMSIFVAYSLAILFPRIASWLQGNADAVIATAAGLGWLAFTVLLSAEKGTAPASLGSREVPLGSLGTELLKFRSEPRLDLDLFAYSTETFYVPLGTLFEELVRAKPRPKSIRIRVLFKDTEKESLLPGFNSRNPVDKRLVKEYRRDIANRNKLASQNLWTHLNEYKLKLPDTRIEIFFSAYPLDPFHKGVLINSSYGLWSLYKIKICEGILGQGVLDFQGKPTDFCELRRDGTPSEAEALRSVCEWFETVWEDCSEDIVSKLP